MGVGGGGWRDGGGGGGGVSRFMTRCDKKCININDNTEVNRLLSDPFIKS